MVLWKPGCLYCERLLLHLRSDSRVTWVNVWQDDKANAQVRAVNNGDELTPTVLLGDQVLRNPTAAELRERLRSAGPRAGDVDPESVAQLPSAAHSATTLSGGQTYSSSQRNPRSQGTPSTTRR